MFAIGVDWGNLVSNRIHTKFKKPEFSQQAIDCFGSKVKVFLCLPLNGYDEEAEKEEIPQKKLAEILKITEGHLTNLLKGNVERGAVLHRVSAELIIKGLHKLNRLDAAREQELYDCLYGLNFCCPEPLPAPAHFVGRQTELQNLLLTLQKPPTGHKKITLVGPPGIGKTSLARQAIAELFNNPQSSFRAVLWLETGGIGSEVELLYRLVQLVAPEIDFEWLTPVQKNIPGLYQRVREVLNRALSSCCYHRPGKEVLLVLEDLTLETVDRLSEKTLNNPFVWLDQVLPDFCKTLILTTSLQLGRYLGAYQIKVGSLSLEDSVEVLNHYLAEKAAAIDQTDLPKLANTLHGYTAVLALAAVSLRAAFIPQEAINKYITYYETQSGPAFDWQQFETAVEEHVGMKKISLALRYTYRTLKQVERQRFRALGVLVANQPFDLELLTCIWQVDSAAALNTMKKLEDLLLVEPATIKKNRYYFRQNPIFNKYALTLLKENEVEWQQVNSAYQNKIIELSRDFGEPAFINREDYNFYLPHIQAVVAEFYRQIKAVPVPDDFKLKQLQTVIYNLRNGLHLSRDPFQLNWLEIGLEVSQLLNDRVTQISFLSDIGSYQQVINHELEVAHTFYQQALDLLTNDPADNVYKSDLLCRLGTLYSQEGSLEKAIEFYNASLALVEDNQTERGVILANLGQAYFESGQHIGDGQEQTALYKQSINTLEEALNHLADPTYSHSQAQILLNLGGINFYLVNYAAALTAYEKALKLLHQSGDCYGEVNALYCLAKTTARLKPSDKAEVQIWLEQAHKVLKTLSNLEFVKDYSTRLTQVLTEFNEGEPTN